MKAAVLYEAHGPLQVERIDIMDPKAREVMVKIAAAGVCHSDLHVIEGDLKMPLPSVLGHEAAGTVLKVGPEVSDLKAGDHVVLSFQPSCGKCRNCATGRPQLCEEPRVPGRLLDGTSRLSKGGQLINHFANVSSFAEYAVVPERGAVKVRNDAPLEKICLVGCGVMTGVGAAINTAKVEPGSTAVVIGCGGVGLNVVQGCALAGAGKIIAVDISDYKLGLAEQFGATHVVNATRQDPVAEVQRLTGGPGADFAFEVISTPRTIRQAFDCIRPGGKLVVVGIAPQGSEVSFPTSFREKTVTSSSYGSARPWADFPKLIDLYMVGKLKIDELVTRERPLDEINEAFAALKAGEVARTVLIPA